MENDKRQIELYERALRFSLFFGTAARILDKRPEAAKEISELQREWMHKLRKPADRLFEDIGLFGLPYNYPRKSEVVFTDTPSQLIDLSVLRETKAAELEEYALDFGNLLEEVEEKPRLLVMSANNVTRLSTHRKYKNPAPRRQEEAQRPSNLIVLRDWKNKKPLKP